MGLAPLRAPVLSGRGSTGHVLPASSGAGGAPARSLCLSHAAEEPLALLQLNLGAVVEAAACSRMDGGNLG